MSPGASPFGDAPICPPKLLGLSDQYGARTVLSPTRKRPMNPGRGAAP